MGITFVLQNNRFFLTIRPLTIKMFRCQIDKVEFYVFSHRIKLCNAINWKVTNHLLNCIDPPLNHQSIPSRKHLIDWIAMLHPVFSLILYPILSYVFLVNVYVIVNRFIKYNISDE